MNRRNKIILALFFVFTTLTAAIIGSFFIGPFNEQIVNYGKKIYFGESKINIDITRNYVVYNTSELQSWDFIFLTADEYFQGVVFRKTKLKLSDDTNPLAFFYSTGPHHYNYLIFIRNKGNRTAEKIEVFGKLKVKDLEILDYDSRIEVNPNAIGGLIPNERTFRFSIPILKRGDVASLRLGSNQLSDISIDCTIDNGNCDYGIFDNRIPAIDNFPITIKSQYNGKPIEIDIPDLRYVEAKEEAYIYNPTKNIWVSMKGRLGTLGFDSEIRITN